MFGGVRIYETMHGLQPDFFINPIDFHLCELTLRHPLKIREEPL